MKGVRKLGYAKRFFFREYAYAHESIWYSRCAMILTRLCNQVHSQRELGDAEHPIYHLEEPV